MPTVLRWGPYRALFYSNNVMNLRTSIIMPELGFPVAGSTMCIQPDLDEDLSIAGMLKGRRAG
jgi:hypothetical protein